MDRDSENPTPERERVEHEERLLDQLDRIGVDDPQSWRAVVAWVAPKMARENPKLLAEIVIRNAMRRATREDFGFGRTAEAIAQEFAAVGLKFVVEGTAEKPGGRLNFEGL